MTEGREINFSPAEKGRRGKAEKKEQLTFATWKAQFDAAQTTNGDSHEIYQNLPVLEDPKAVKDFITQELQKETNQTDYDAKTLKHLEEKIIKSFDALNLTDIPDTVKKDYDEIINIIFQERYRMYQVYKEIQGDVYLHTREYIQNILETSTKLELSLEHELIYKSLEQLIYKSNLMGGESSRLVDTTAEYLAITTPPEEAEQLVQDIYNFIQSHEVSESQPLAALKILADKLETRVIPQLENGIVTYLGNEYIVEGDLPPDVDAVKQLDHNGKFALLKDGILLGYIQKTDASSVDSPEYLNPKGEFGDYRMGIMAEYAQKKRVDYSSKPQRIPCKFYAITPKDVFRDQATNTRSVDDFLQNYDQFRTSLYQHIPDILKKDPDLEHQKITTELHVEAAVQNLGLREQFWLYNFIKKYPDKIAQLTEFITMFGQNGLSTFSSAEYDSEIPLSLLEMVKEDDPGAMKYLLEYYAHFNYMINVIGTYTSFFFKKDTSVSPEDIDEITKNLSKKYYDLMAFVANSIKQNGKVAHEVWTSIDNFKESIVLFAESFKTFFKDKEKGQVDFSEIKNLQFDKLPTQDLPPEDKKQMIRVAQKNWAAEGALGEDILTKFQKKLDLPGVEVYLLKKGKDVIAFLVAEAPTPDNHRNVGSFNVERNAQGAGIGEAVLLNVVAQEGEKYILDASVLPKLPVGMKYIHDEAHIINGLLDDFNGSGETFFKIQLNKKLNERLTSKNLPPQELLTRLTQDETKKPEELIEEGRKIAVYSFDQTQKDHMLETMRTFLDHGYIGTDYLPHPEEKNKRIYVFELVGEDTSS